MKPEKRFVKYDGNTIVDLKLVKSWIISSGDVDLLIELLNNNKTPVNSKIVKESKKENKMFLIDKERENNMLKFYNKYLTKEQQKIRTILTISIVLGVFCVISQIVLILLESGVIR